MGSETDGGRVRLQVTVDRATAERIADLATRMNRTQSWLAAELLAESLANQNKLIEWFALRLTAGMVNRVRRRHQPSGDTVTLQTFVMPAAAVQVEGIATEMKQSISKTAACLLESALNDHGWIIEFVQSSAGRKLMEPLVALIEGWNVAKKQAVEA